MIKLPDKYDQIIKSHQQSSKTENIVTHHVKSEQIINTHDKTPCLLIYSEQKNIAYNHGW